MEALNARFNVLQEMLMDIYESGKEDLETQIEHWKLLRQEQALLFFARKHSIMRLGYQPVPPMAVSETKAKQAIGMMLTLQSLQKSPFGKEKWTLVNTSLETYNAPPAQCFKKGPYNIEVIFDGDPENLMVYTAWKEIYFVDSDDMWQKVQGEVDYAGAYYKDGTIKQYYVTFADDAVRYGTSGQYEVRINNETVFAPVTSSTPPSTGLRESSNASPVHDTVDETPTSTTATTTTFSTTTATATATGAPELSSKTGTRKGRYGRKDSSPTAASNSRKEVSRRRSRSRTRTRRREASTSRSQKASRSRSRSRSTSRGSRGSGGSVTTSRDSSPKRTRRGRGRGGRSRRSPTPTSTSKRERRRSRSRGGEPVSAGAGISPDKVGSRVQTVSGRHLGRLGRLLEEASDPPVILLRGDPNILKCYRYRDKKRKLGLVKHYSTTWSWVGVDGNERIGRSRMLLSFTSNSTRSQYVKIMKLPKGVEWSFGNFDKL